MASHRVNARLLAWFTAYSRWYLRRNFHSFRVASGSRPQVPAGIPLIVCMNHPSWWDPLAALVLARETFPERQHFAPIESAALEKYKFFEKIGFFGIEPATPRGAATFLRRGLELLSHPANALWVTAQGTFVDARKRPIRLQGGVGRLAVRCGRVAVLPLAIEYTFWSERYPELLARWGSPILIDPATSISAEECTALAAARLEETADRLAADSISRNESAFEVLIGGNSGIGGVYDIWRAARSRWRGERFERAHGSGRLS